MSIIICTHCKKEFASAEALEMHVRAKHGPASASGLGTAEKKVLRQEEHEKIMRKKRQGRKLKSLAAYASIGVALVLLVYWIVSAAGQETYTPWQVHWHAGLAISICGKPIPLPSPEGGLVHGQPFVGTPFMHLHAEPLIHIEGLVRKKEDITLGRFMESIGMPFNAILLLDHTNGNLCANGRPGAVTLLVNGASNPELDQKVIVDGEQYELRFE